MEGMAAIALFCLVLVTVTVNVTSLTSVEELDNEKFMGLWYEVYTDLLPDTAVEDDRYCVTNFYRERDHGYVTIHHTGAQGAPNGTSVSRNGYMVMTDPNEPGQFFVYYVNPQHRFNYWILDVGPVDHNGMYSYAIASDSTGSLMWVSARNVTEFYALYNDDVLVKLETMGFNGTKAPVATFQGGDCRYENMEPVMPVLELDVSKYMGLWYEMYTDGFVRDGWENETYCHQKNYALRDDGVTIGVHNYHTIGSPDGISTTLTGWMVHNENFPGEFLMRIPQVHDVLIHVWVLDLGPLDEHGLYSYAITSDPTGTVMWVLARNVSEFNTLYDAEVNEKLVQLGFTDGSKEPVASYQGNDCAYENIEEVDTVDDLALSQFYGLYYEMYTDNFVATAWESETYCGTVNFAETNDGSGFVNYHNYDNEGSPNGTAESTEGYMVPYDEDPAKFSLHLPEITSRAFPYWVIGLGPLDDELKYAYVIMGGSTGLTMWVYARNVTEFNLLYDDEVRAKLNDMGYITDDINGDKKVVSTYQGEDCVYENYLPLNDDDEELSRGARIVLHVIMFLTIGIFIAAIILIAKNYSTKSPSSDDDEESVHLVTDVGARNPLSHQIVENNENDKL